MKWSIVLMGLCFWVSAVFALDNESFQLSSLQGGVSSRDPASLSKMMLERAVDSTYVIGPGDLFDIYYQDNYVPLMVSAEGKVALESVGAIHVAGLPLYEAKKKILDAVSKVYASKESYVVLSQARSFKIGLYGAVRQPGQYSIETGCRLSLLIRMAGDPLFDGDINKVRIIRMQDTLYFNLKQAELTGDISQDPLLQGGDLITIPFRWNKKDVVTITSHGVAVNIPWNPDWTGKDYLVESRLFRHNITSYPMVRATSDSAEGSLGAFIPMSKMNEWKPKPGMILEPTLQKPVVFIGGSLAIQGQLPYRSEWNPAQYVLAGGKRTISGRFDQIYVKRATGEEVMLDPFKGVIYPGDYIELPESTYERVKDVTLFLASVVSVFSTIVTLYLVTK